MSEYRQFSHGRGGAGNMSSAPISPSTTTTNDLVTPTLKAHVYTTGRGGSGNMVPNDDPELARVRQDVDVPPPVKEGRGDGGRFHTGRGGAANVYSPPPEAHDLEKGQSDEKKKQDQEKGEGQDHAHNPIKDALHRTLSVVSEKREESEGPEKK